MRYTVTAFINVSRHPFDGYEDGQPVATADDLVFRVEGAWSFTAAEEMFRIGQKQMGGDTEGRTYPLDVRSFSVGDVVKVVPDGANAIGRWLACATGGFRSIETPTNIVELAGTKATSRRKETA